MVRGALCNGLGGPVDLLAEFLTPLSLPREIFRATNNKNKAVSDAVLSDESEAANGAQTEATPLASSSTPALPSASASKPKPVSKNECQLKDIET